MTRIVLFPAALCLACSARGYAQRALFEPSAPVVVGRGPGDVLLADLDRDGHLDLLTRHLLSRSIGVRLGDGRGHFARRPATAMHFRFHPGAATLGDVDADGIPDLVVASRDEDGERIHIFRGDGRGGFDQATGATYVVSAAHRYYKPMVRLADIDEDGAPDVVTANGQQNTLEILLARGRGTFAAPTVLVLGPAGGLYTFAVGDVDGDGHLDVVAASSGWSGSGPGRVAIERGDGRGGFTDAAGPPASVPPAPRLVALADVNGDGRSDVVLAHSGASILSIFLSEGEGRLTAAPGSPIDIGMEASAAAVTDVDLDRHADIVVATVGGAAPFDSRIVILLGNGREFAPGPGSPFPAQRGTYHLAVGDIDEDGRPDVAGAGFESDAVAMLRSHGAGSPRR